MTNTPGLTLDEIQRAKNTTGALLVFGLIAALVGGLIVGLYWPGVEPDPNALIGEDAMVATGNETYRNLGYIIVAIAQLPVFVALVSYGVSLGIRGSSKA